MSLHEPLTAYKTLNWEPNSVSLHEPLTAYKTLNWEPNSVSLHVILVTGLTTDISGPRPQSFHLRKLLRSTFRFPSEQCDKQDGYFYPDKQNLP